LAFNLSMNAIEPLLRALGAAAVRLNVRFQLGNAILGCTQLMREPLCSLQRMSAIFLGNISGFVELLQDRLARSVELISFARCGTFSRTPECNGVGLVAVAGKLTMHHKPPLWTRAILPLARPPVVLTEGTNCFLFDPAAAMQHPRELYGIISGEKAFVRTD
jgi:hypothetical protein